MRITILLLFMTLGLVVHSQSTDDQVNEDEFEFEYEKLTFPKYAIGISPSSFANFYSGIQISNDFGIKSNVNLAVETAYIYHSTFSPFTNGFRLKLGPQLMLFSNDYFAFNVGANYNLRHTKAKREFSVFYWEESYSERFEVDRLKTINGGEITMGIIAKMTDRLRFELGFGFGAGYLTVEDKNSTQVRNEQFQTNFNSSFLELSRSTTLLLGSFNCNFSYAIVKN